ncbi:phage tail protein [Acinetobacter sp. c3-l95]|uniref:phage tail protein n=1 Tax=Acinetobacter sp. c3-l95 TaxID=3342804 RepID=UPI0035B6F147
MITNIGDIQLKDTRSLVGVSSKFSYNFAQHDKALGKPSRQRIGENLTEWRLQIKLHYQFCDPATVLERLQHVLNQGQAVPLVFDYLNYAGVVTLDDMDVVFVQTADNGRPLIIEANLTLTEFDGDSTIKPPAPAVRDPSQSKPVQTAVTDDINSLLPSRQPLQDLEQALIQQHQAKALLRITKQTANGDFSQSNELIERFNQYMASNALSNNGYTMVDTLPLATAQNIDVLTLKMQTQQGLFAQLATAGATRQWH